MGTAENFRTHLSQLVDLATARRKLFSRFQRVYCPSDTHIVRRYALSGQYASQDIAYCFGDYLAGDVYVDIGVSDNWD